MSTILIAKKINSIFFLIGPFFKDKIIMVGKNSNKIRPSNLKLLLNSVKPIMNLFSLNIIFLKFGRKSLKIKILLVMQLQHKRSVEFSSDV